VRDGRGQAQHGQGKPAKAKPAVIAPRRIAARVGHPAGKQSATMASSSPAMRIRRGPHHRDALPGKGSHASTLPSARNHCAADAAMRPLAREIRHDAGLAVRTRRGDDAAACRTHERRPSAATMQPRAQRPLLAAVAATVRWRIVVSNVNPTNGAPACMSTPASIAVCSSAARSSRSSTIHASARSWQVVGGECETRLRVALDVHALDRRQALDRQALPRADAVQEVRAARADRRTREGRTATAVEAGAAIGAPSASATRTPARASAAASESPASRRRDDDVVIVSQSGNQSLEDFDDVDSGSCRCKDRRRW
jgi:hypothetical protein